MQNYNIINIRKNRFNSSTTFEPYYFKNFDFEKGLKSIKNKKLLFINKAESETEDVFNSVLDMYLFYLDNDLSFLTDDFLVDEILWNYRAERLIEIINEIQKTKYKKNDLKNIIKLNNKTNPALHFFVKLSRNNLSLVAIDLYHMGIYGDKKGVTIPMERIYRQHQNNDCGLERIKELIENQVVS